MPKLEWIGKDKVITHHLDVPYRVLNKKKYHFPDDDICQEEGNMIIHGDNLEALKALLPKYEGGIHCIYIDPPKSFIPCMSNLVSFLLYRYITHLSFPAKELGLN